MPKAKPKPGLKAMRDDARVLHALSLNQPPRAAIPAVNSGEVSLALLAGAHALDRLADFCEVAGERCPSCDHPRERHACVSVPHSDACQCCLTPGFNTGREAWP